MNTAIIGMGSNIDPEKNIQSAIEHLGKKVTLVKLSGLVRTAPIGITDQPDFLNGAVKIRTELPAEKLEILLKVIENSLGRDRSLPKYGPRTIDLDLVVWNDKIVDPDYYSRPFLQKSVEELTD